MFRQKLGLLTSAVMLTALQVRMLTAQRTPTQVSPPDTGGGTILSAALATITTDTGTFAPGHRDFTTYTTPLLCIKAVDSERDAQRRTVAAQEEVRMLANENPAHDTLPTAVITVARTCGARFLTRPVATTPVPELNDVFQLALLAGDDSLAHAVVARQLAIAPTDSARFSVLTGAMETYVDAKPIRIAAVKALAVQFEAQGYFHQTGWERGKPIYILNEGLRKEHDEEAVEAELRKRIEEYHHLSAAVLRNDSVGYKQVLNYLSEETKHLRWTYTELANEYLLFHPDSLLPLAQRWQHEAEWSGLPSVKNATFVYGGDSAQGQGVDAAKYILKRWLDRDILLRDDSTRMTVPLHADAWFPASDSIQPKRGTVSLMLVINKVCYDPPVDDYWVWARECDAFISRVSHLATQYEATGLKITIVAANDDHAVLSPMETPAQAARDIAWYFQTYQHLPVTVAVQHLPYTQAPAPSELVTYGKMEALQKYYYYTRTYQWLRSTTEQGGKVRGDVNNKNDVTGIADEVGAGAAIVTDRRGSRVFTGSVKDKKLDQWLALLLGKDGLSPTQAALLDGSPDGVLRVGQ